MKNQKSRIGTLLLLLLLFSGLVLIFVEPIQTLLVKRAGDAKDVSFYTAEELRKNNESEADFEFEAVQSLSIIDVLKAQANIEDVPVIGSIAIPNVKLQLPIFKGVSNDALAFGAGTMKPDQVLGKGNYALAGHYFEERDILFSPLANMEIGDKIYVTDLEKIYVYETTEKKVIEATDVYVIDDIPGDNNLTLITCAEQGTKRLSILAEFSDSYEFEDAPTELSDVF